MAGVGHEGASSDGGTVPLTWRSTRVGAKRAVTTSLELDRLASASVVVFKEFCHVAVAGIISVNGGEVLPALSPFAEVKQ